MEQTDAYKRITEILQECASNGYSILFRKAVLDVEGTGQPRPVGVEIIISGLPELDLRIHKAITYAQAEELPAFATFVAMTFRKFTTLVRLRAECLRIIQANPSGIRFAELEAEIHAPTRPVVSPDAPARLPSEKLLEMLQSLAANKLISFALGTYYPV